MSVAWCTCGSMPVAQRGVKKTAALVYACNMWLLVLRDRVLASEKIKMPTPRMH